MLTYGHKTLCVCHFLETTDVKTELALNKLDRDIFLNTIFFFFCKFYFQSRSGYDNLALIHTLCYKLNAK